MNNLFSSNFTSISLLKLQVISSLYKEENEDSRQLNDLLGVSGELGTQVCIQHLHLQTTISGHLSRSQQKQSKCTGALRGKKKKRKKGSDSSVNFSKSKELFRKTEGTQSWGTNLQSALNSRLDMINSGVSVLKTKL